MSLFVKVACGFFTHRKTLRLRAKIGTDAFWVPPRLWAYAAENQPDGDFSGYSDEEIATLIGYEKDATSMLQALLQAGFLTEKRVIHDWEEHNSYHKTYSDRAKLAAKSRWDKQKERTKEKGEEKIGEDRRGEETSIASSNATSINPNVNGLLKGMENVPIMGKAQIHGEGKKKQKRTPLTDEELIQKYSNDETYKGINVRQQYGKMVNWCKPRGKIPSERRFVNWLNNADSPILGSTQRTATDAEHADGFAAGTKWANYKPNQK